MNSIELGRAFADDEVAALYQYRAPYPRGVFPIAFEAECRDVFARRGLDRVRASVVGYIAWGFPT
jgi:hypothetical protein